jgi:dGTPase
MECADDVAYGVHDLEDIVGRHLVRREDVMARLATVFGKHGSTIGVGGKRVSQEDFESELFSDSYRRKGLIGKLVNLFVTSTKVVELSEFSHPLLRFRVGFDEPVEALLRGLKGLAFELVVQRAEVQQLERRGQRIVEGLFKEFIEAPRRLIPEASWKDLGDEDASERRVCDYIAGMTDPYAERIYQRLFIPGVGSSRDEL